MGFESYRPTTVTVRAGETVEWRNTSLTRRDISGIEGRRTRG